MAAGAVDSNLHDRERAFVIFRIVFTVVIFVASVKTMMNAIELANWALLALATVEAIAAVFFLLPRYLKTSGIILMAIFLLAIVLSFVTGVVMNELQLIVYLVCTYFITVHGNTLSSSPQF